MKAEDIEIIKQNLNAPLIKNHQLGMLEEFLPILGHLWKWRCKRDTPMEMVGDLFVFKLYLKRSDFRNELSFPGLTEALAEVNSFLERIFDPQTMSILDMAAVHILFPDSIRGYPKFAEFTITAFGECFKRGASDVADVIATYLLSPKDISQKRMKILLEEIVAELFGDKFELDFESNGNDAGPFLFSTHVIKFIDPKKRRNIQITFKEGDDDDESEIFVQKVVIDIRCTSSRKEIYFDWWIFSGEIVTTVVFKEVIKYAKSWLEGKDNKRPFGFTKGLGRL